MAVSVVVVTKTPPNYSSRCTGAGAEVCVAWIRGVAAVVGILFSMGVARSGLVKCAIVAGAVDARIANGTARHVRR